MQIKIFALLLATTFNIVLLGQDSLPTKKEVEVSVTAFRFPGLKLKVPFTTQQIKNTGWNMQAPSMAEVLQNTGFVNVQKSQAGGGSPVIRGFEASRILLMVDGVRMNNAIYRAGHLQNIITVDANALQQVDILYGPSSTQYGSDALGGVVHMRTKTPTLNSTNRTVVTGNINTRYSSAMQEAQQHIDLSIGGKKWGWFGSFTYSNFGDVTQGKNRNSKYSEFGKRTFYVNTVSGADYKIANPNVNKQIGSAYNQVDMMQKLLYKPTENQEHILNIQYSNSTDIPRYDRLTEITANGTPRFGEWYYGPQKRFMAAYQINQQYKKGLIKNLQSLLSYQAIEESRYDRRFGNRNRNNRIENIAVLNYTLDALAPTKNGEAHIGIDIQHNDLQSEAYSTNIVTQQKLYNIANRYPNGKNTMSTAAAYAQQIYNFNKKTTLNFGVRATTTLLKAAITDNTVLNFPFTSIKQQNGALVGNVGITYRSGEGWKYAAVVSNGFRTPNFDELKVFDSRVGFLIVPNENIKPEYSYNAEMNVTKYTGSFQTEAAVFYTLLRNTIQIDNATLNGSSSVLFLGVPSQVQMAVNKGKGFIAGASVGAKYYFSTATFIEGNYTYSYGRIDSAGISRPLDHVPPTYGRIAINHKAKKWDAQLFTLFNGWKRLKDYSSSGEDNLQYATVDGMPSWLTVNIRTSYQLHKNITAMLGIENVIDKNYRPFASGISAPGRNFVVGVKAGF